MRRCVEGTDTSVPCRLERRTCRLVAHRAEQSAERRSAEHDPGDRYVRQPEAAPAELVSTGAGRRAWLECLIGAHVSYSSHTTGRPEAAPLAE